MSLTRCDFATLPSVVFHCRLSNICCTRGPSCIDASRKVFLLCNGSSRPHIHLTPYPRSVSVAAGIAVPGSLCSPIFAILAALSHRIHHFNSKPACFQRVFSFPLPGPANAVCSKLLSSCLSSASSPGELPTSFLLTSSSTPHVLYAVTSGPTSTPHSNSPFSRLSNLLFTSSSYPSLVNPVVATMS
jgi:hypothetical protein